MMTNNSSQGILRFVIGGQVNTDTGFPLPTDSEIILGREPSCDIPLDAYTNVSRRHASIRPAHQGNWVIYDLNSSNGTYINGIKLQGGQFLRSGDRIRLSQNGPEFLFEYKNLLPITFAPQSQPQVVSQPQTIEERRHCLKLFPRRLVINYKQNYSNNNTFASFGWWLLFILFTFFMVEFVFFLEWAMSLFFTMLCLWVLSLFSFLFWQQVVDYIFDLETNLLTIHYQRVIGELFKRKYKPKQYSFRDFTSVRLRRAESGGNAGERLNRYTIFFDRKKGRTLKLGFTDRNPAQAKQLIDFIEQYLSYVEIQAGK